MIQKISANSVPDHRAVSYINTTVADDGTITFENDGNGIDVAKHPSLAKRPDRCTADRARPRTVLAR
jgi:hypothetical protein